MPRDWLNQVTWTDVVAALAALLLIGGVVLAGWKFVHPIMVKITRVLDLFLGRPAERGIPAVPGVIERLDAQDDRLEKIEKQVTPNHGSTSKLAEDVQGLRAALDALIERFEEHLKPHDS